MSIPVNLKIFREFFSSNSIGGIILLCCVIASLIIANSPAGEAFANGLAEPLGLRNDWIDLRYPALTWINDGLMAIFFLLIGLEIKRELIEGELSSPQQAALPVFAAFGGAILPALIYLLINKDSAAASGWGIPMATDIAFALAVISMLGNRVPPSLKIFLAALAIADDLIAIIVIAVFYSSAIHLPYLAAAAGMLGIMFVLNRLRVKALWCYLLPGIVTWYCIHHSGIHATIAGVLTASMIPATAGAEESPLERLEHILQKPVNFLIMPLFAIANTNISFAGASMDMLVEGAGLGIMAGLLLGKPIGIGSLVWLTVKWKWAALPEGAGWPHIIGLGILGGIGFTMSIFIALLSFKDPAMQVAAKFAILAASAIAGLAGWLVLYFVGRKKATGSNP